MKIYKLCFTVILLTCLLGGCSNVKDANKSNFKTAAQDFLDTQYPYSYIMVNFPYRSDKISIRNTAGLLHEMARLGLVEETEVERRNVSSLGSGEKVKIIYSYELVAAGAEFYKPDADKNLKGEDFGAFCFGKANVVKIINFTEPTDYLGVKVAQVTYAYTVTDIPEWAKDEELLKLDSQLKEDVQSAAMPLEKTETFVLTDKGWVHEQLFQR